MALRSAHFSNTTVFAGQRRHEGRVQHLIGYQNVVQNLAGRKPLATSLDADWGFTVPPAAPSAAKPTGNAMVFAIPAVEGSMSPASLLDTGSASNFLKDMAAAIQPRSRGLDFLGGISFAANSPKVVVFEHDVYSVVLIPPRAQLADALAALSTVSADKRPALSGEDLAALRRMYPDPNWYLPLCCFNNADAQQAKPLLWAYDPVRPDLLYAPGLDAHEGLGNLDFEQPVQVDHNVVVSSLGLRRGSPVHYSDIDVGAELNGALPRVVLGEQINKMMDNGDFWFRVSDVDNGVFNMKRDLPPGVQRRR